MITGTFYGADLQVRHIHLLGTRLAWCYRGVKSGQSTKSNEDVGFVEKANANNTSDILHSKVPV
jgi:hypothetical protein